MPLIQKPQMGTNGHVRSSSLQLQAQHAAHQRDEKATSYDEIKFDELKDDEGFDSDLDLENSIFQTARRKTISRPPVVPPRSDKRASKMLANVMLELQNLDGSMTKDRDTSSIVQETDPHELYLSSEEDASLADDYEDSLLDFNPTDSKEHDAERERAPSSGGSSRKSQEITARAVSFMLVRPQVIHISSSTSTSPKHPVSASEPRTYKPYRPSAESTRRPSPLKRYPNSLRRLSISSIASLTQSPTSASPGAAAFSQPAAQPQRQLRKASRMANLSNLVTSSLPHSFLNTDPYASNEAQVPAPQHDDDDVPSTPKTPTSIAAAAFKKGLTRGLNRARQPSLSSLSSAFNSARGASVVNLSQTTFQPFEQTAKESSHQRRKSLVAPSVAPQPQPPSHDGPLTYEDIMKNVIREPPPKTPLSAQPSAKVRPIGILGLGRRRSVKAS